ncbi:hypothetical protein ElyMa_005948000 [Elysia marginata]|uniref:MBD domain-containing protein n=1 Tax=Elysia marginata TaxID=1093978 RepID=A0AAV4G9G8_9GAST|nr:hypothetical protein ElyMa_005948000 [Elysia marginata]
MQEGRKDTDNPSDTDESDSTQTRHKSPEGWSTAKKNKKSKSRNDGKNNKRKQTECTTTHDVKSTDTRGRAKGRLSPRSDITKYLEKARSISSKRPKPDTPTLDLNQRSQKQREENSERD